LASESDGRHNISDTAATRDERRAAVDIAVPHRTRGVIAVVPGCEEHATEVLSQDLDVRSAQNRRFDEHGTSRTTGI
jgi:hypothetical protein